MKKTILIILALVGTLKLNAQDKPSVEKHLFKINLLLPGAAYEHGLDTKNTLFSQLAIGFGYRDSMGLGNGWYFLPTISEQYRHYYNLEKRSSKGKVTTGNSGGYIGLFSAYSFKSLTTNDNLGYYQPLFAIGPVWGFQRTYKHNFNINMNLGLGHYFQKDVKSDALSPIINFTLGWKIGK